MGDNSAIEWTNSTWNVVTGCDKVSPGCRNCYAERYALRTSQSPGAGNVFTDLQKRVNAVTTDYLLLS